MRPTRSKQQPRESDDIHQHRRDDQRAPDGVLEDQHAGQDADDTGKKLPAPQARVNKDADDIEQSLGEPVDPQELHQECRGCQGLENKSMPSKMAAIPSISTSHQGVRGTSVGLD